MHRALNKRLALGPYNDEELNPYSPALDAYSFAVSTHEMITGGFYVMEVYDELSESDDTCETSNTGTASTTDETCETGSTQEPYIRFVDQQVRACWD